MIQWAAGKRVGPIGVDIGHRSVKLVQLSADGQRVHEAARWDLPAAAESDPERRRAALVEALRQVREGRRFVGKKAVLCLTERELFLQNIRVPKIEGVDVERAVHQEAASRIPHPLHETDLRYWEAAEVRQTGNAMREVILLACHRPVLEQLLATVEAAGLRPAAVDCEPSALLRCGARQFRREADQQSRTLFVHLGYVRTLVVIAQGDHALFVKYLDCGGQHCDEAVARALHMEEHEASALRRHNGDRRAAQQDPEVARSIAEAQRPVVEKLAAELSMCMRYHSVTFRGQPLSRLVLGGGEATAWLAEELGRRLDLPAEVSEPFRHIAGAPGGGRSGQWEIAAGLALQSGV